ncbi:late competence protein ComER [Paenibacillus eucommiae]|uniref:Pyrroline-5-carboxylate reductase n=1 Tax=Paenibacillus eucommiae TaxID=1355755 RepID=A0ABS4J258_9BACL|nr:late competence protein ComER [Paenibacillus eucommiae]MBP1992894.1 competence protein ComER [Paenibacillus eucommiae]
MKAGFIGTGSMGSILIESFIHSGALLPDQIIAGNRTISKVEELAHKYQGLQIAQSNIEVVHGSEIIFLCIKPNEYKKVIDDIQNEVLPHQIVVSITSSILLKHLQQLLPAKISKAIPSITNFVLSGVTLCMHGDRMQPEDQELLEHLFANISSPIRVSEEHTRISSDLSSCGPAFLANVIQCFIDAAVAETGISAEEATFLASEMALGTGKLLTTGGFSPSTLQRRVCVPGGITAEGIRIMNENLSGMFNKVIQATHAKYEEDLEKAELLFAAKL